MSKKEDKKKEKQMEKTVREYKQWEKDQAQFLADFQMMEDYLEALSRSLKGTPEEEKPEEE